MPGCAKCAPPTRNSFRLCPKTADSRAALITVREALRWFREALLSWADTDVEPARLLDSFPMLLCACYRIRQSGQPICESGFAYNSSKREYYFGLHPGVLMTESGFLQDIILAPAHYSDVACLEAYLDECLQEGRNLSGQEWVMDKGFVSKPLKKRAHALLNVTLLARQRDYSKEGPDFWQQLLDRVRKPIEGVISVLTECFHIEHLLVRSDIGLYRRTQAKATAFSLGRYFNQVLGGAVLFMPILLYGFGLSARNAAGTGILLLLCTVVVGTFEQALHGYVSMKLAMAILIGSSIGTQFGALTTHYLPNRYLRLILLVLVLIVLGMIAWNLRRLLRG